AHEAEFTAGTALRRRPGAGFGRFLDDRVPLAATLAAAGPLCRNRPAGLAHIAGGGLGHQGLIRLFRPGAPSYNRRMDMSNSARQDTGRPASGSDTYNRDFYAWAI